MTKEKPCRQWRGFLLQKDWNGYDQSKEQSGSDDIAYCNRLVFVFHVHFPFLYGIALPISEGLVIGFSAGFRRGGCSCACYSIRYNLARIGAIHTACNSCIQSEDS